MKLDAAADLRLPLLMHFRTSKQDMWSPSQRLYRKKNSMICDVWTQKASRQNCDLPYRRSKQVQVSDIAPSAWLCIERLRHGSQGWRDKHRCATKAQ
jgi:hypothetical protein